MPLSTMPVEMNDDAVNVSVAGAVCAVCGGPKAANRPFCPTDHHALPLPLRWSLDGGASDPYFPDNFRAALRHLQLNATRKQHMPSLAGEWQYRTPDDLTGAGYRFSRLAQCSAPRCGAEVAWYRTPQRGWVAVNPISCQPHATTCRDAGHRERRAQWKAERRQRRRVQTSAQCPRGKGK